MDLDKFFVIYFWTIFFKFQSSIFKHENFNSKRRIKMSIQKNKNNKDIELTKIKFMLYKFFTRLRKFQS